MGCNSNSYSNRGNTSGDVRSGSCVADVVRDIVRAQRRVAEAEEDSCRTGCDRSIEELLSPALENVRRPRHNTIPFILFTKECGKAFTGVGVRKGRDSFECIESPIFRVRSFVDNSRNCVRLELLEPVRSGRSESDGENRDHRHSCDGDFCDFLPNRTRNFRATGICITVDLDCFCGISCLDPITPVSA